MDCSALVIFAAISAQAHAPTSAPSIKVTPDNFVRAETDMYMAKAVEEGAFGKLVHVRTAPAIDKQSIVRMNRDTLYSQGVFDLDAGPVTIKLPDSGKRFQSLQVLSEDQYTIKVVYAPGTFTFDRASVGTRYMYLIARTLADPGNSQDLTAAHAAQDGIKIQQQTNGSFHIPNWDSASRDGVRNALKTLAAQGGGTEKAFGNRTEVDPVQHLIGAAVGWGGNPLYAAKYILVYPPANDGTTVHTLQVKDVPVDGFWSISVYNADGLFEKNDLDAYSLNNLTATREKDGSYKVQFGGCSRDTPNCLPIVKGWNYTVRLYRARPAALDGTWSFPEARSVK